nr:PREDICTED: protein Flattop [Paralichthys olivaceus]
MSSNYSANQYESSFRTHRHNNWCERKPFKQRPQARTGHTIVIANDRGHLLPGAVKRGSAWPDFKGTWDLPSRIPACHINPTGRSVEGLYRLKSWGIDPQHTGTSQSHSCSKKSERLQDVSKQILVLCDSVPAVKYDLNDVRKHAKLDRMNNVATVFVFFTVLINIFITALGFEGHIVRSGESRIIAIPEPQLVPLPNDINATGVI